MNSNSIRVQFAFIAALLVTAPAYAQWSSPFMELSQQWQAAQQHYPPPPAYYPRYEPSYTEPPIVQYHNYTFPSGGRLSCSTYSNVTHCY